MKRTAVILAVGLLALASCKKEKAPEQTNIITTDYEPPKPSAPIASEGKVTEQTLEWVEGRKYTVTIDQHAVDSLPKVENEIGQLYVDNAIRVEIKRADGSVFYNKTFTKASFAGKVDEEIRKKALLGGMMVMPRVEESKLVFITWLNYPDAIEDAAVLKLNIDRNGNLAVQPLSDNEREDLIMSESAAD
jgi:hypothetical protein